MFLINASGCKPSLFSSQDIKEAEFVIRPHCQQAVGNDILADSAKQFFQKIFLFFMKILVKSMGKII